MKAMTLAYNKTFKRLMQKEKKKKKKGRDKDEAIREMPALESCRCMSKGLTQHKKGYCTR